MLGGAPFEDLNMFAAFTVDIKPPLKKEAPGPEVSLGGGGGGGGDITSSLWMSASQLSRNSNFQLTFSRRADMLRHVCYLNVIATVGAFDCG